MKKIDFSQTIAVLANVGIIASIVFLGIELGQNHTAIEEQNKLDRLTGRDAAGETFNGFRKLLLENPNLIPIWERGFAGETLTPGEQAQFRYLCEYRIWGQFNLLVRLDALALTSDVKELTGNLRGQVKRSESFRRCWDNAKGGFVARGYEQFVRNVEGGGAE